jgi:hypothetical protein
MTGNWLHTMHACSIATALGLALPGCADWGPAEPHDGSKDTAPQFVINGEDDFEHPAAAALMVYDPNHPEKPGWRSMCSAALIHKRVIQTAGHCIQFLEADLAQGRTHAAWISFQQDPIAHFSADPALANPASGGWYEIASLHNNPDNVDFIKLRQSDPADVLAVWGKFHDSGAIVLKESVKGIKPMKMVRGRGEVGGLIERARCATGGPACRLLVVTFGLQEFPPVMLPPVQVRQSALLRYKGIDPLFISTFDEPPGSAFGANCLGDSGAPIILQNENRNDRTIVAISSSPADPFGFPCTTGSLQYRVDTDSHRRFIRDVIRSANHR